MNTHARFFSPAFHFPLAVRSRIFVLAVILFGWILNPEANAESYHVFEVRDLKFAPGQEGLAERLRQNVFLRNYPSVQVRIPEEIERYFAEIPNGDRRRGSAMAGDLTLAVRFENDRPVSGFLDLPKSSRSELVPFAFTLDPKTLPKATKAEFEKVRSAYFAQLASSGLPGAAWFRHHATPRGDQDGGGRNLQRRVESELSSTFAFFSGGEAISENLALDRELILGRAGDDPDVAVSDIKGITVTAIDWAERLPDEPVKTDALAGAIPLDQHAMFVPSPEKFFALIDLVENEGAPVFNAFDVRSPFRKLPSRYLAQLGLGDRAALLRLPVKSLAMTGGDPFLPTGSDVALLFETDKPGALFEDLGAAIGAEASRSSASAVEFGADVGLQHRGFQTPTRSFSSHVVRIGKHIVVTNSTAQIERLQAVLKGDAESLGGSDEFAFFRHRYPIGEDETAFLFLSDATIRRWGSPRMRIGASRRARARAALGELTARQISGEDGSGADFEPLLGEVTASDPAQLVLSASYGSLGFVTPVGELQIDQVSAVEKAAYENWRRGYERGWSQAFDPIAIRLALSKTEHRLDLTVLPLTVGSDYRTWIALAGKATLTPMARHSHPESLLFTSFAVDSKSDPFGEFDTDLSGMMPGLKVSPLAWVDRSVSVFFDEGFYWRVLGEGDSRFLGSNLGHLPIGVRFESKSKIKLALFLTGLRGLAESSAPDLLRWETRQHGGRSYVAVRGNGDDIGIDLTIFYAAMPTALLVSLDEDILKRAIDRENRAEELDPDALPAAEHALLMTSPKFLGKFFGMLGDGPDLAVARRSGSWRAIPILNEWHRRESGVDPSVFHLKVFSADITCPGGKGYRWNAEAMTMESVAYGHPAEPRDEPLPLAVFERFNTVTAGLGFEDDGLRVRASLSESEEEKPKAGADPQNGKLLGTAESLALSKVGSRVKVRIDSPEPGDYTTYETEVLPPKKGGDKTMILSRSLLKGGTEKAMTVFYEEMVSETGLSLISEKGDFGETRYTKPYVELPAKLIQGQASVFEYVSTTEEEDDEGEIDTRGEITILPVGFESVTVPAGTFEDCVRVEVTDRSSSEGQIFKSHSTLWYKEGLGVVKEESPSPEGTYSNELVEFEIPDKE